MAEITIPGLRKMLRRDLELAQEKVRTLEEQLKRFDELVSEGDGHPNEGSVKEDEGEGQQSLLAPVRLPEGSGSTKAIRELMVNAPGEFNVPGIAKAVSKDFPNLKYKELSRKGSQVANRLAKRNKIKMVRKGIGREPNTYISAKYSDA
jgi:hypothetical protein